MVLWGALVVSEAGLRLWARDALVCASFEPAGRLEPFHLAYAEHRGDACKHCCYVDLADSCDGRTLCKRGFPAGNSLKMKGCGTGGGGARAVPETMNFRAWQAADARPGGRVAGLGIMQPSFAVTSARS